MRSELNDGLFIIKTKFIMITKMVIVFVATLLRYSLVIHNAIYAIALCRVSKLFVTADAQQ
jgi:hypothetical protein